MMHKEIRLILNEYKTIEASTRIYFDISQKNIEMAKEKNEVVENLMQAF